MTNKSIYFETEKYQDGGEGDFVVVSLKGDTYEAREIIKQLGYRFSNQVGYGKAWRAAPIFLKEMSEKAPAMKELTNKTYAALTEAGYKVTVRR